MASIRVREQTGKLFFDFRYRNKRCREQTALDDTPANRRKLETILKKIEAEITLGSFEYARYFPGSSNARKFSEADAARGHVNKTTTPLFNDFADTWFAEMQVQWRRSHSDTVATTLRGHLKPEFGDKEVGSITKAEILSFRSQLAKVRNGKGKPLSAERINHIMTPLRMILNEAADRHEFTSPYQGIKSLKVPRTDVEPFTVEEVRLILQTVREDYRNYYTVRFFTGMRTGEIDGLQWQFIDFERRQILVRQSLVKDELVYTKNDGSFRSIDMSGPVYEALLAQKKATGQFEYVFCSRNGSPLTHRNVTQRVWYPLLRHLGLRQRRPYQTRHTAATLWLAAGEAPEWIARQMGHTTTEMLFRVYSRYVPNLTRRDGSAMERLLIQTLKTSEPSDEVNSHA
ncbi:MAG TPA: integrase [Pseudomonas sp.]|jgi:integrase|nr:integrase [Pseudomonas sp.]